MATHDANRQDEQQRECFLCTLDPRQPCHTVQLAGRIVAAQERLIDGERTPVVLLDTGTARVEVHLDSSYYRSLVKELKTRSDVVGPYNLTLRIYHLPTPPTTVTYKEQSRLCYRANAYTLAIVEPDILLNITDLNQAEYCARQYVLNRLIPSTASAATMRGNLVHHCFKELLKEHDRGKFRTHDRDTEEGEQPERPLAALYRHLEQALQLYSIDMALADVTSEAMRADVLPHLESLAQWYERERTTLWDMPTSYIDEQEDAGVQLAGNQVRAETFLLAPEIGLRGRLDLFWQQSGRQRLLELKTGGATGNLPKREHRWQVYGYHALLTVRRDSKMKKALATLLYSGTPGSAQAFGIPASIREIQRVNETRNMLVLSRITGIPPAPPGPSRCTKCAMLESCQDISALLQWQPPEPDPQAQAQQASPENVGAVPGQRTREHTQRVALDTSEDRLFFARYYRLLQLEGHAGEEQQALLWKLPVSERIERGSTIRGLEMQGRPVENKDGWELVFRCNNTSELREGDEILLSNGDPITGEVVTGTITAISSEQVTVWTRELIAHPDLIDRYDNELVHIRTLQNLLRWQRASSHLRDLVAGKVRPRFIGEDVPFRTDFNSEQNLAVARALQMQDYLLIHGPPGTGKTSVIAEIVKRLAGQGQRIMLAAFTNQAVDNMLKRLDRDGFHDYLRLGHERSVDEAVRPRLLKALIEQPGVDTHNTDPQASAEQGEQQVHEEAATATNVRHLLQSMPVVASTTATWSSDKYTPPSPSGNARENMGLAFDVAIIDEAGQLTVPAILGALRFVKRFILVGDEKQLPPLVLSKEAAAEGLGASLFSSLKSLDDDYTNSHPLTISACVPLRVQYRMNRWIANFSSTVFYEKQLYAHESVAHRCLEYRNKRPEANGAETTIGRALDPRYPLVFLDVRDEATDTEAKQSNAEAQAVRDIVGELLTRGIEPRDIGIIAPYRAQVANIRRHLFRAQGAGDWPGLQPGVPLSVDTVDRFQGGERSVIIMSFATSQEPASMSQRREFLINPHRLNVALTRAQRKLILVGSVPALENLPTFSRLITYCRSMNTVIAHHAQRERVIL